MPFQGCALLVLPCLGEGKRVEEGPQVCESHPTQPLPCSRASVLWDFPGVTSHISARLTGSENRGTSPGTHSTLDVLMRARSLASLGFPGKPGSSLLPSPPALKIKQRNEIVLHLPPSDSLARGCSSLMCGEGGHSHVQDPCSKKNLQAGLVLPLQQEAAGASLYPDQEEVHKCFLFSCPLGTLGEGERVL